MRYLVVEKLPDVGDNPFSELVSGGDTASLPYQTFATDLNDREASDLGRDPGVADVVPSMPFTLTEPVENRTAGDAETAAWGLDTVGALSSRFDGEGVSVAVLDTGIDSSHAAFSSQKFSLADVMDFTSGDLGVLGGDDFNGHGTSVAGVIFGGEVDGFRLGVAQGIRRVIAGKVIGDRGGSTDAAYNGLLWALSRKADVISMSLGIDFSSYLEQLVDSGYPLKVATSRALQAYRANVRLFDALGTMVATAGASARGAVIVAASGNDSRRIEDRRFTVETVPPGVAEGFISVGAVGRDPGAAGGISVASFSNTGCQVSAPGVQIISAKRGGGVQESSGTSMATPHVAGVLALWIQKLFPDGSRPRGWVQSVMREMNAHLMSVPASSRYDVGLGVVQAPQ